MAELLITKKFRMTQKDADKLKELSELSGLKESEVIRVFLDSMILKREKVPKDLMDSLNKLHETSKKIESVFKDVEETGNVDTLSLKVYISYLDKLTKEVRAKYL